MDNINDRIMLIITTLKMNKNSFSNKIKLSGSAVLENIVSGRRSKPSFDVLQKIILAFDNIDANWLITGKGEMFKADPVDQPLKPAPVQANEPAPAYNCKECKHKQEIINSQKQQIETLHQLAHSKDELINQLRGNMNEFGKCG